MNIKDSLRDVSLGREFMASVVVFLVALPLCMGIAIASGVPPALGLITGIVGGLVVGVFAGSPLQVSGPAAGLAVIVWDIVQTHGLKALGPIVLLAGLFQLIAGVLKAGQWFRAVSPAVIKGMLAGIGVLIFAGQFHVMVDDKPQSSGLTNLATIPESVIKGIFPLDGSAHHLAAALGILTIVVLIAWDNLKPKQLRAVPGALVAIVAATAVAQFTGWDVKLVDVPDSLVAAANWMPTDFAFISDQGIWTSALVIAAVASAETLLCAGAVDQLHDGPRTKYNQELIAQGIGNMLCGVFGALPMTGVIVRSSANVEAGGRTRLSAILHGAWLLGLVALAPFVLKMIPTSALAAILVFTGYKLLNPANIIKLWKFNRAEAIILMCTLVGIVSVGLLNGVIIGLVVSTLRLVVKLARLEIETKQDDEAKTIDVRLRGCATFLTLPRLAETMDALPMGYDVHIHIDNMVYIDHACIELIGSWERARKSQNTNLKLGENGWEEVMDRYQEGPMLGTS